jgi:hypothetical protein
MHLTYFSHDGHQPNELTPQNYLLAILCACSMQTMGTQSLLPHRAHLCRAIPLASHQINPLPSVTLQSAQDLNVPFWLKHSKALLLSYTFKCPLKKIQSFCPCGRALNRSGKGLNDLHTPTVLETELVNATVVYYFISTTVC